MPSNANEPDGELYMLKTGNRSIPFLGNIFRTPVFRIYIVIPPSQVEFFGRFEFSVEYCEEYDVLVV